MRKSLLTQSLIDTVDNWDGTLLSPSADNRRRESVSVFRAQWFERTFATAHPALPWVWWLPIVSACIWYAAQDSRFTVAAAVSCVLLGFLAWTLLEYVLHRFWFHHAPEPDFDSKLAAFMLHGYHHEFPNDRMRLVAPLILSVPLGALIATPYLLLGGVYYGTLLFAGTVLGYLAYDGVHYYTHHFRPTTRVGKFLRRYHMEHHYKDSTSHFGISSPLWDWVFGTAGSAADKPVLRDAAAMAAEADAALVAESKRAVTSQGAAKAADKHSP